MIKLHNLDKYFNKGKSNEIHVINDISLTLPDAGLVTLLGPSGSGKTTLLNVIGGLDKAKSGVIELDNIIIDKYKTKTWDNIRNEYIGYIFQNYNLLNDLSVFDNIELVLKMAGITDKEEINNRINYILEAVGMYNFRHRVTSALSGGQQQRVAIARVLAKNPKIIIADEPTGNLDSRNTLEIMNIIKKISQHKLVVLVTHERDIANFYADRIIELKDGKIEKDYQNTSNTNLSVRQDHAIYLKDMQKSDVESVIDLNIYHDQKENKLENVKVNLIFKNNTLYLDIDAPKWLVKPIDSSSEVKVLDKHYEDIKIDDIGDIDFDIQQHFSNNVERGKMGSFISLKDSAKYALRKLSKTTKAGRFIYLVLALVGLLFAISVGAVGNGYNVDEDNFLEYDKNYVAYNNFDLTYDEVINNLNHSSIDGIMFIDEITNVEFDFTNYYQYSYGDSGSFHISSLNYIDESNLVYGTYPTNNSGVVIDVKIADKMIENYSYRGVNSYNDFLNSTISYNDTALDITGLVDTGSPTIFANESYLYKMTNYGKRFVDTAIYSEIINITEGRNVENMNEIVVSSLDYGDDYAINDEVIIPFSDKEITYTIVGKYEYTEGAFLDTYTENNDFNYDYYESINGNTQYIITTLDTIKSSIYNSSKDSPLYRVLYYSNDKEATVNYLNTLDDYDNIEAYDIYKTTYGEQRNNTISENRDSIIMATIIFAISAISFLFIIRSSLLSRIKEISIYRALGATKRDIIKMFMIEIVILTTISSIFGYAVMCIMIKQVQSEFDNYISVFYLPYHYILAGALAIYLINIIGGLVPVFNLLRKTPSEILNKYDM